MARRHESRVSWKLLAFYGAIVAVVIVIGSVAIWSFIEKQSLVINPEALPKITIVTGNSRSPLAAAWVRLLTRAELSPTLVPLETFDPIEGVVIFCDVPRISPQLAAVLDDFVHRGGAIAFLGAPPETPIGKLRFAYDHDLSDGVLKMSESVSPVLARITPGYELPVRPMPVTMLKESPRMVVDARWKENARAVVMHMEDAGARYLWIGLDPRSLTRAEDNQLMLLLRTAFRWVSGQPISDGAIGAAQVAKTLTPDARLSARKERFAFSVDRMPNPRLFSVRMTNRGDAPLPNPTVKIWLPPRVTKVALAGGWALRRNATLTGVPEEGACLVSLPSLTRNEDRVLKLKIVERTPPRGAR
ncbi:MAG TPA: hypothetical protein VGR02_08705 [Thermoanaerobaculia bacterium]|jgi:hypothetical protein|nr:hypothetical protein [Thermoanaerobaculia bacterium]